MNYITVDGGTSNTRISLVCDRKIVKTLKYNIGARLAMDKSQALKETIKNGINDILKGNETLKISRILASGMITSEFGLLCLDHAELPIGIKGLSESRKEILLKEISSIPFVFMRGVKSSKEGLLNIDMMRGEETELMGLIKKYGVGRLYILPGSHSKHIKVDEKGMISSFSTMLTGEMIGALCENTILRSAVDLLAEAEEKSMLIGFECAKEKGLSAALFKCRILQSIYKKNKNEIYGFFMGAVLSDEVEQILRSMPEKIVIGGQRNIKTAMAALLKTVSDFSVEIVSDEDAENAASLGAVEIYEYE